MLRLLKVATPPASVATVTVPPRLPPAPVAMVAVTFTPAWFTGLLAASRSCTMGAGVRTAPLAEVAGGWVVIVRRVPVPAESVMALEVTPARPLAVKSRV